MVCWCPVFGRMLTFHHLIVVLFLGNGAYPAKNSHVVYCHMSVLFNLLCVSIQFRLTLIYLHKLHLDEYGLLSLRDNIQEGEPQISMSTSVRDLGLVIDAHLVMTAPISNVTKSSYCDLKPFQTQMQQTPCTVLHHF